MAKYSKCHDCGVGRLLLKLMEKYQEAHNHLSKNNHNFLSDHARGYCVAQQRLSLEVVDDLKEVADLMVEITDYRKQHRYVQ